MRHNRLSLVRLFVTIGFLFLTGIRQSAAQTEIVVDSTFTLAVDSTITVATDSLVKMIEQNLSQFEEDSTSIMVNNVVKELKPAKDWSTWRPDPKRALWLALVIPGGGQIYNRKYWKLPLVYGGFMGCIYAMSWNNSMYMDYSQAYLDLMDDDPGTQKRKDKYRRWRDLSFFCLIGVYALSVIDAYVDAELSVFDISKDLSLKVEPTIINNHSSGNLLDGSSVGLQCSLNF